MKSNDIPAGGQSILMHDLMQVIDPHTHQYMERMRDEVAFLALAAKAAEYLERRGDTKNQARIALRRVEHFYVKTDDVYGAIRRMAAAQKEQADAAEKPAEETEADMEQDPEVCVCPSITLGAADRSSSTCSQYSGSISCSAEHRSFCLPGLSWPPMRSFAQNMAPQLSESRAQRPHTIPLDYKYPSRSFCGQGVPKA